MSKVKQETPAEVRRRLNRRLDMHSAGLAIKVPEEVASHKKAPAPARRLFNDLDERLVGR